MVIGVVASAAVEVGSELAPVCSVSDDSRPQINHAPTPRTTARMRSKAISAAMAPLKRPVPFGGVGAA